jgi:hypothetical protein
MSLSDFFANVKRYNENATLIFDQAEPIGRAADLVVPRRRWFLRRRDRSKIFWVSKSTATPERS